jgi:hypothetical protein
MLSPLSWTKKLSLGLVLLLPIAGCSSGSQHRQTDDRSATRPDEQRAPTLVPVPAPAAEEARYRHHPDSTLEVAAGQPAASADSESIVDVESAWSILPTRHTVSEPLESQRRLVPCAPKRRNPVSRFFHNLVGDDEVVAVPVPRPARTVQPIQLDGPQVEAQDDTAREEVTPGASANVEETVATVTEELTSTETAALQNHAAQPTTETLRTEDGIELWPYRPTVEVTPEPVLQATQPTCTGSQNFTVTGATVVAETVEEVEQWPYRPADVEESTAVTGANVATIPDEVEQTPEPATFAIVPRIAERKAEASSAPALNPLQ